MTICRRSSVVERLVDIQDVRGSNPFGGTIYMSFRAQKIPLGIGPYEVHKDNRSDVAKGFLSQDRRP